MTKQERQEWLDRKAALDDGSGWYKFYFRISASRHRKLEGQVKPGQKLTMLLADLMMTCSVKDIEKLISEKKAV